MTGEVVPPPERRAPRLRWLDQRIARLGFLIGLGWDVKRVAGDPIIACLPNNVYKQAQRLGLSFRETASMIVSLQSTHDFPADRFDKPAIKRGLTREGLVNRLLLEIVNDPILIDNILDDGDG